MLEALNYSRGNQKKLGDLFPSQQAVRGVAGFAAIYNRTGGTNEEKLRAVSDEFERLRKAQLSQEEVTRAFGAAMTTSKSQIQIANDQLDKLAGVLETNLLPAVAALAPAFAAMAPVVAGFVEKFAKWLGIDVGADDKARQGRTREDTVNAGESELAADIEAGKGPKGKKKSIDQTHIDALKRQADELNAEAAAKEADQKAHPELYQTTRQTAVFGPMGVSTGQTTTIAVPGGAQHVQELKQLQDLQKRTNDILEKIRVATEQGLVAPPAPVQAKTDGVEPGDALTSH